MSKVNRSVYMFVGVGLVGFLIPFWVLIFLSDADASSTKQCEDTYFVDMPLRKDIPLGTADVKEAGWLAGSHRIYISRSCE